MGIVSSLLNAVTQHQKFYDKNKYDHRLLSNQLCYAIARWLASTIMFERLPNWREFNLD